MKVFLRNLLKFVAVSATLSSSVMTHAGLQDVADRLLGRTGALRIVLNDVSSSVHSADPRGLFIQSSTQFLEAAQAGDELIVATIGDKGSDAFRAERFSIAKTGRSFDDKALVRKRSEEAIEAAKRSVADLRAPASRYLESLRALQQDIATARAAGKEVLVRINGDALENGLANFEASPFDDAAIDRLLATLKASGTLIALAGAGDKKLPPLRLSFVGVGGKGAPQYERVERFWRAYAALCGASVSHYAGTVPK